MMMATPTRRMRAPVMSHPTCRVNHRHQQPTRTPRNVTGSLTPSAPNGKRNWLLDRYCYIKLRRGNRQDTEIQHTDPTCRPPSRRHRADDKMSEFLQLRCCCVGFRLTCHFPDLVSLLVTFPDFLSSCARGCQLKAVSCASGRVPARLTRVWSAERTSTEQFPVFRNELRWRLVRVRPWTASGLEVRPRTALGESGPDEAGDGGGGFLELRVGFVAAGGDRVDDAVVQVLIQQTE